MGVFGVEWQHDVREVGRREQHEKIDETAGQSSKIWRTATTAIRTKKVESINAVDDDDEHHESYDV